MSRNEAAKAFKALHVPFDPIIVPNVWDIASLNAVASLNAASDDATTGRPVKAVATSSWSIAGSLGIKDQELTLEQNLTTVQTLGRASQALGIFLTTDLGDGFGSKIGEVITRAVEYGVVGGNIEDNIPTSGHVGTIQDALYDLSEQVERLKVALKAASDAGAPDFVLNARSDIFTLAPHPSIDDETRLKEAIKRGKAYLAAGATTVFFPTFQPDGLSESVVRALVEALGGRITLIPGHTPAALSPKALGQLGVARLQFGATFFILARDALKSAAAKVLAGENIVY